MKHRIVRETVGGEIYEYVPLGKYVVSARTVCGGRPTFKYTRIEVAGVLELLGSGFPLERLLANYEGRISSAAVREAATLAGKALANLPSGQTR